LRNFQTVQLPEHYERLPTLVRFSEPDPPLHGRGPREALCLRSVHRHNLETVGDECLVLGKARNFEPLELFLKLDNAVGDLCNPLISSFFQKPAMAIDRLPSPPKSRKRGSAPLYFPLLAFNSVGASADLIAG